MKKIIILSAVLLLAGFAVNAETVEPVTCEPGTHWVSENPLMPGYYTDGECNEWSESICLNYENQCTNHSWVCRSWWHGWCMNWDYVCTHYENVCVEYSEPECLGYAEVWNEPYYQEGGQCIADSPKQTGGEGGISLLQYLPKVNQDNNLKVAVYGKTIVVNFLSNYMAIGNVLYSKNSQDYPVSVYGYCTLNGVDANLSLGANNFYGYSNIASEGYKATYHTVIIEVKESGVYYLRPLLTEIDSTIKTSNYVLGQEIMVIVN